MARSDTTSYYQSRVYFREVPFSKGCDPMTPRRKATTLHVSLTLLLAVTTKTAAEIEPAKRVGSGDVRGHRARVYFPSTRVTKASMVPKRSMARASWA